MKFKPIIGINLFFLFFIGCADQHIEYSIEAFMNTVSIRGSSFSPDEKTILFSSDKTGIYKKTFINQIQEVIDLIKNKYQDQFKIIVAPCLNEMNDAKAINAICILDDGKAIDISQLSSLIKDSSFVIANDTGPAHMAAHLNAKGLTLFGSHTTAHKVSIERENFKVMQVSDLNKLSAIEVFEKLTNFLN